jgi:hypothetical protein
MWEVEQMVNIKNNMEIKTLKDLSKCTGRRSWEENGGFPRREYTTGILFCFQRDTKLPVNKLSVKGLT